jgi:hypothetical protein
MNADFTSLPPAQEQQFVVFEQYRSQSAQKALTFGIVGGGITFVLGMLLYFGFPPKHKDKPDAAAATAPGAKAKPAEAPAPK